MFKPARWLALALVALVLGLLQMPGIAVASPTLSTVVCAYGTPGYGQPANDTATERASQAATNDHNTRCPDEDHSQGNSARPEVATGHRDTTYDPSTSLVQGASASRSINAPGQAVARDPSALQRSGVAAKSVDEVAQVGDTVLYQKLSSTGEHLKYGITKNPATRYTSKELNGGSLNILARGPKQDMLALERSLHEWLPIGPEEGQLFYIQKQIANGLRPPPYPW